MEEGDRSTKELTDIVYGDGSAIMWFPEIKDENSKRGGGENAEGGDYAVLNKLKRLFLMLFLVVVSTNFVLIVVATGGNSIVRSYPWEQTGQVTGDGKMKIEVSDPDGIYFVYVYANDGTLITGKSGDGTKMEFEFGVNKFQLPVHVEVIDKQANAQTDYWLAGQPGSGGSSGPYKTKDCNDDDQYPNWRVYPPLTSEESFGGIQIPVDKLGLLAPHIGLASAILVTIATTTIYIKRIKQRKEKQ